MPSTIPYDPSLVLASVVNQEGLRLVGEIAATQAPVDTAHDELNALLASRKSLDVTLVELENLGGIESKRLHEVKVNLNTALRDAAVRYATEKVKAEKAIPPLRSELRSALKSIDTPVDYVKSEIKTLPLATDSLSMDVQYFPKDSPKDSPKGSPKKDSEKYANRISKFVSDQTSFLGTDASIQMATTAQKQASQQAETNNLVGTLVFSISCTHKNVAVFAPLILNVDKGFKIWNSMFGEDDRLDPTKPESIKSAAKTAPDTSKKFSIISGVTYGSSFVGMVHILGNTNTSVSQTLESSASSWQAQMNAGAWFAANSGGFGVTETIGNEIKHLLSTQNVASHVTLISAGVIPSAVANNVKYGVEKFAKFDPHVSMETIATIQNATIADQTTIKAGADAARIGQQMMSLKAGEIKATLSALAEVDDGINKSLDVNSMMTALNDYINKIGEGHAGVPINYYLKDITKDTLAQMWMAKYFPSEHMNIVKGSVPGKSFHGSGAPVTPPMGPVPQPIPTPNATPGSKGATG